MALPCLFCGDPSATKEHIIPKWVAKNCGLQGVELGATTPDARRSRKQNISFKSHRKRFFCEDCQRHFKLLEDAARPLVIPMCRGESASYDSEQQRVIARWATKSAFGLIASEAGAEEAVPFAQRQYVRQNDHPPEGVWVAFVTYDGLAQKDVQTHSDENVRTPEDEPRTLYSGFLSFGWVAFKVFGVDEVHVGDSWYRYLGVAQLWPPRDEMIEWPSNPGVRGKTANHFRDLIPLVGYVDPVAGY